MSFQSLLCFFSGCCHLFFLRRVAASLQASFFGLIPSATQSFGVRACPGPLSQHRGNFLHSKNVCRTSALMLDFQTSCRFLFRSVLLCTAELRCSDPLWSFLNSSCFFILALRAEVGILCSQFSSSLEFHLEKNQQLLCVLFSVSLQDYFLLALCRSQSVSFITKKGFLMHKEPEIRHSRV